MPNQRENENPEKPEKAFIAAPPERIFAALHQVDEDILERDGDGGHLQRAACDEDAQAGFELRAVPAADVQDGAESGDEFGAWQLPQFFGAIAEVGTAELPGEEMLAGDDLFGRARGEQGAVGNIGEAVAALGLVHVVRRDQDGDTGAREAVDFLPKITPSFRVYAGGRFVEQQQSRLMQQAGGEREALLPAA